MTKFSKDNPAVEYRAQGGTAFVRCGKCSMFRDGSCTLVKGPIASYGVCKKFEPQKRAA